MASTNPTWYTDAAKTSAITLPNWRPSASTTIHCWLAITSATNVFSVTVADRYHTGVVISFTVPQQFRTMDFLAGGHGVAFGKPATEANLFECELDAIFNNGLKKINTDGTEIDYEISDATIALYDQLAGGTSWRE